MESSQSVEHCNSLTLSYYFVLLALLLFIFQAKALVNEDCQVLAFSFFSPQADCLLLSEQVAF